MLSAGASRVKPSCLDSTGARLMVGATLRDNSFGARNSRPAYTGKTRRSPVSNAWPVQDAPAGHVVSIPRSVAVTMFSGCVLVPPLRTTCPSVVVRPLT